MGFRYIGAKTKISDNILGKIKTIVPEGGHVVDLMCGTGAVSAMLRRERFNVTAIDMMTFCFHHARVALLFTKPPEFENAEDFINTNTLKKQMSLIPRTPYQKILDALNSATAEKGYFWNEFSVEGSPKNTDKPRSYFSSQNAMRIDAIRNQIKALHQESRITDLEHSLLLHDLIMAANDVANIAGTYGHYLSKMVSRANSLLELKPSNILLLEDEGHHKVKKGFAEELAASISCDLCYIDPPYMKRQYAANYHILETLARGDEPEAIGVSGLRPWRDQYSNFCTKTKIRDSFGRIFREMKCEDFLISYSEDGLLSMEELRKLFSQYGTIQVSEFRYKRFKSNNTKLAPELSEYLIHLKKGT